MILATLAFLGFHYKDKSKAMVAQVENQVMVISTKAHSYLDIYVVPGQEVKKGDKLFLPKVQIQIDIYQKHMN